MIGSKLTTCGKTSSKRRIRRKTVVFDETEILIQSQKHSLCLFIRCTDVSVTGVKLQICEEQEANGERRQLCSTKQKSRLSGTRGQEWYYGKSKGN